MIRQKGVEKTSEREGAFIIQSLKIMQDACRVSNIYQFRWNRPKSSRIFIFENFHHFILHLCVNSLAFIDYRFRCQVQVRGTTVVRAPARMSMPSLRSVPQTPPSPIRHLCLSPKSHLHSPQPVKVSLSISTRQDSATSHSEPATIRASHPSAMSTALTDSCKK